jgi:DNA polymerase-1
VHPVTIDFETEAIAPRPDYPPKPVGVSIKYPGEKARYYAFGHPEGNNCTKAQAQIALAKAWSHEGGVLCHNAKFDIDVAETHMNLPQLPWDKIHDTMLEVFLHDPHAPSHALKAQAEVLLGIAPTERDEVRDWLVKHGYCTRASKNWGAFICKAPGDLVGKYADGDVIRTEMLHRKLMPVLKKRKMIGALDRERELLTCLLDMERQGVPVDLVGLMRDCEKYDSELAALSSWCHRRIKSKVNLDSGEELVNALIEAGKVDTELLGTTPTGAYKTDKAALARAVTDKTLSAALNHRASLQTCLGTFMKPWLETARASKGYIFTQWNQLKQYGGKGVAGAVTGRLSSSPNFQNIPKEFSPLWAHQQKGLPKCPLALSPLPLVRSYIIAPKGYVLLDRDYSQQEIRILAHFEDGALSEAYLTDAWMDAHQTAMEEINARLDKDFKRGVIKQINFGLIYGMGIQLMADKAGCTYDEAAEAKRAVLSIYPGLKDLQQGLRELAQTKQPLRTWGGREYHCEPPKLINGQPRTFEYKMLNVLVQGSAADQTKQAVINYYRTKPVTHKLLLTVHDEMLAMCPQPHEAVGMQVLQGAMEFTPFEVPMTSEGKISITNWAELVPYDKKGVRV